MSIILVLFSVALVVAGQLLLKTGMLHIGTVFMRPAELLGLMRDALTSPYIWGGLMLMAVSSLIWLLALSREQLSYVQPFGALVYIFVLLFSWMFFKEDVGLMRIIGVIVITAGVALVARS